MKKKILIFIILISAVTAVNANDCVADFWGCWNSQPYEWGNGDDGEAWRNYYQDCSDDFYFCMGAIM